MNWVAVSLAAMTPLFVGCSTHPLPDDVTRIPTSAIVAQIRCEARRAVMDYSSSYSYDYRKLIDYKTATVGYEFDFDIQENNNATADASWSLPYTLGGAFTLGATAGMNRNRHTTRNFRISDTFDELLATKCVGETPRDNILYPIAGDIGVYEVVKTFIEMQQIDNPKSGTVFTFHDTLIFTTTINGGVTPRVVMTPLTDQFRLIGAGADLSARRSDIHKVVLTLAGDPPKSARTPMGSSLRTAVVGLGGLQTNSSLVSTTIIQSGANPRDRALLELDRQRILALQARTRTLLVGP